MKEITRAEAIASAKQTLLIAELERKIDTPKYLRWQWWEGETRCYTRKKKIHIAADRVRGHAPPLCCESGDDTNKATCDRVDCLEPWELSDDMEFSEGDICKSCVKIWRALQC